MPLQLPGSAVSVCPSRAVPEMVGGEVLLNAAAATTAVWAEVAPLEPALFEAVTATRIVAPTSATTGV